ncbi:hypothetical protein C4588_02675, partial [Candidatus Parcubacteria bacterium]
LLEKMDDKYAYLRNPQGDLDIVNSILDTDTPKKETVYPEGSKTSGGHIKIKKGELFKNLTYYYIPMVYYDMSYY